MNSLLCTAERFREGSLVLVADEEADAAFIAAAASAIGHEQLAHLQTLGHGSVMLGMSPAVADRLQLPAPEPLVAPGAQPMLIAPITASGSIDGGWSLHDRALTMRVAADPRTGPGALAFPGHVLAGRIEPGAPGAAAAALELAQLAVLEPVVALCPVLDDAGRVAPLSTLLEQPRLRSLLRVSSAELNEHAAWRLATESAVTCALPMRDGHFRAVGVGAADSERVTTAFVHGDPAAASDPFVHVHVACQLGDVFGSLLCGCQAGLRAAVAQIVAAGCGVIVYTQPAEPSFMRCPRGEPFPQPEVTGLLRSIGVNPRLARAIPQRPVAALTQMPTPAAPAQRAGQGELEVCA